MNTLTLFDALKMIEKGRASEILDQLNEMHLHSPQDIPTNYVLAHALDVCGQKNRAESVWNTIHSLQPRKEIPKKIELPDKVNVFTHTDSLQIGLNRILEKDEEDEIRTLIQQLDSGERTPFDEALLAGDIVLEELPEESYDDDPITETFARILVAQKKYSEASLVYRSLSEQNPDDKDRLLGEAERLELLANQGTDS